MMLPLDDRLKSANGRFACRRFTYTQTSELVPLTTWHARPRQSAVAGRGTAHFEPLIADGRLHRSGLIAEHRQLRIDADGNAAFGRFDLDLCHDG